jgi:hypothetical protein
MPSYYEIKSYNSSPNSTNGATSLLILPFNKSFLLFLYQWWLGKNLQWQSKKEVLSLLIKVNALLFFI